MPAKVKDKLTQRAVDGAKPGQYLWDSEVRGFGLRVTPGGTKTFIYQFRTKAIDPTTGKLHQGRIKLGTPSAQTSVADARKKARAEERKVEDGANPSALAKAARTPIKVRTLRDLAKEYTEVWAAQRGLRPKTVSEAERLLAPVLAAHGDKPVAAFTHADVAALHAQARTRKPAKVAPKAKRERKGAKADEDKGKAPEARPPKERGPAIYQANRLLAALHKLFALAIAQQWPGVTVNPCQHVEKYQEHPRKRKLSDDEIGRLLLACDACPKQWGGAEEAVRLLLFTGARLREVLNAEWTQFDLEAATWVKPSSHTKTKIVHRVSLSAPAVERLTAMRTANPLGRFLFPGKAPTGTAPTAPRADINKPWKWLVTEADLKDVRIHDLRRTTASVLVGEDVNGAVVGAILGHTQASTTARYISVDTRPQEEATRRAGERMLALKAEAAKRKVISINGDR